MCVLQPPWSRKTPQGLSYIPCLLSPSLLLFVFVLPCRPPYLPTLRHSCRSCGNALLSAFVLIPIAIVLSVVFLASMASWGNAIPPLVNMYHCDGMDRSAYEDILGGIVVRGGGGSLQLRFAYTLMPACFVFLCVSPQLPNNAPELLQYDAVPNDCLTDLEGNQNNKVSTHPRQGR